MMTLSTELQSSLESKIKQFEEERTMPLVSNMELRGIEQGKEIGKEIGALEKSRDAIKTVLTVRFGQISSEIEEIIGNMTNPTITVILTGGNDDSFTLGTTTWITSIPLTQGGTVSFAWSFAGEQFPDSDRGGYIINGTPTYLATQDGDNGNVPSLSLTAGQTFGFIVETANNTGGAGILTINEFDFIPSLPPNPPLTQVPENDTIPVVVSLICWLAVCKLWESR